MANKSLKHHSYPFPVLEHRPVTSSDPQGNRMLTCVSFSVNGMTLKGAPRFDKFKATLSMPQNGQKIDAEVTVVKKEKQSFEVTFNSMNEQLYELLSWWDYPRKSKLRPESDQNVGIDV